MFQGRPGNEALEGDGWSYGQRRVRHRILDTLVWPALPEVDNCLPSLRDFQNKFSNISLESSGPVVWLSPRELVAYGATISAPPPIHLLPKAAGRARDIWHSRLRSSRHYVLPSPAAILFPRGSGAASSSSTITPATWPLSAPVPKPAPSQAGLLPRGRRLHRPRKRARVAVGEA